MRNYYLQQMGIEPWVLRDAFKASHGSIVVRGNTHARLMMVGDAEKQALPLSSSSGSLLVNMLKSIGILEEDVNVATVLRGMPRDVVEAALSEHIALVAPQLILAAGSFVGSFLSNSTQPLESLRHHFYTYQGIPVLVSYSPESLLMNPIDKKYAYQDWLLVKQFLSKAS